MKHKRFLSCVLCVAMVVSMGGAFTKHATAAENGDTEIVIDGLSEDWNYISPLYMGGGNITKLSAFTGNGTLFGKMEASSSQFDTWHIYLDTDGDYTNHLYFSGAEYVLESDILYQYEGDSGEWEGLIGTTAQCGTKRSGDGKTVEFAIPLSAIGDPDVIGIHAATVYEWEDNANCPEEAGSYYDVPDISEVISEEMTGLTEEEEAAYLASKMFNGAYSQWENIKYDAVFKNSNLKHLKAVTDGEALYISALAKELSNNFTVYIIPAKDGAAPTFGGSDKSENWTNGADIPYVLKSNGTIYKMQGNSKIDTGTAMTDYYKADNAFEVRIPVDFFDTEANSFYVAIEDEGEMLPDEGSEMLYCEASSKEEAPEITLDGDPSDWAGMSAIGTGEGSLGDLYAFRDKDNLYVMTTISGVTDPESSAAYTTSLFIDTDNDDKTGFLHSGYATKHAGDFLLQDWNSYGEDRNLEFFYTDESVTLEWNMKKQYLDGYEKVFAPTSNPEVYCAEYKIPIACFKEVTPAVSDDLYICIDRNDCQTDEETFERKTPEGFTPKRDPENGSFAKVPKFNTTVDISFADMDFSDWDGVVNKAIHVNTLNLCAVKSDEKLFTMITAPGDLTTVNKYYISTEKEGFLVDGVENVSYVVEKGKLKTVTGDDTVSENGRSVYQYYDNDYVIMNLYLSDIDSPKKIEIRVDSNYGEYVLPQEGKLLVSETVKIDKDENKVYPKEDYAFYNNPYKGWVAWADIKEDDIDKILAKNNLYYVDIKWSELEPEKGVYAFDAIEEQYQFDKWKNKGGRMVLRFVMDNPNYISDNPDLKRMDIPQWLYDELEEENANGEGAGTFYYGQNILELLGGIGFSPNYKSKKLLEYHNKAVKALAERYDDPSICAYVEVGSLGHWAEFHTWPDGTGEFPDPKLAQEYMQVYANEFKNVRVGIRKPYAVAANNNWGLYNDVFGVTPDGATPTFLEWAVSGNDDMPGGTEEDMLASRMPEWWKLNYSGGEFANGDFRTNALDENVCDVLNQIRDSHTTWLGPCSACDYKLDDEGEDAILYAEREYNIETFVKTMGYRYSVFSVEKPEGFVPGTQVTFDMVWQNSGVAPIYYDCPVVLYVRDSAGTEVFSQELDADTTSWLPGQSNVTVTLSIPESLTDGDYTVYVGMYTADEHHEAIRLAMADMEPDCTYRLFTTSKIDEYTVVEEEEMDTALPDNESEGNAFVNFFKNLWKKFLALFGK